MKRRLTVSILLAVAAALLLAGVGTLLLARVGAKRAAEDELRSQAETTADLVAFGQTQFGSLSANDVKALQLVVCDQVRPGASPQERAAAESLRASVCTSATSPNPLVRTQSQVCATLANRVERALTDAMVTARADFCGRPDNENLDRLRTAYCTAADAPAAAAVKRVRQNLCKLVSTRVESRQGLQDTLSKESIDLITLSAGNEVLQGTLPEGIAPADLRPDQLRLGESVSGALGTGAFAASAIDPGAETLAVVVIARPSDPVRGLVPWFLLASGITLLIAVVVASSLSRKLVAPLRNAMDATARIADGQVGVRVAETPSDPQRPRDELDALAHSINTMAAALERSRGLEQQFLLSVSHDLRTPLTSIRGYAEAIADGAAPDVQHAGSVILTESRRLERLVKDLLDLAKLDARRFTFHLAPVDLDEIAGDSVDGFRREVEAAGLTIELVPAAAPAHATTDPDRLQQVIANLVENALKFAHHRITVRVVADPAWPRIEVEDDGPGIATEDLPHVFERLYVAAATPQRKETGSGLGLAIVRELVEAMGGHVHAAAAEGHGTRMIVTVPSPAATAATTPPAG